MKCSKCNGTGFRVWDDDPSAAGVSLSPGFETFAEPCTCYEDSTCPMCGAVLLGNEDDPCMDSCPCGWTALQGERDVLDGKGGEVK